MEGAAFLKHMKMPMYDPRSAGVEMSAMIPYANAIVVEAPALCKHLKTTRAV